MKFNSFLSTRKPVERDFRILGPFFIDDPEGIFKPGEKSLSVEIAFDLQWISIGQRRRALGKAASKVIDAFVVTAVQINAQFIHSARRVGDHMILISQGVAIGAHRQ